MKKLRDNFLKIKKDVVFKNELNILKKFFLEKNLNVNTINFLLNGQLSIEDLNINEKIALCRGLYKLGYDIFNPVNYFTSSQLLNFESLAVEKNNTNIVEFENVSEYNDDLYIVPFWKPSEHVKAWNNRNIRYNFDTQRQGSLSVDKWGNITQKMTINRKSVEEIKKMIKDRKYFPPDMITLNILQLEDKEPLVKYDKENRKLTIQTESDFNSKNTTFLDIIDGMHRTMSLFELEKEGIDLDKIFLGFPVQISITTTEQANSFIYRQAQANKQSVDFLEQRIDDKYKKVVDKIEAYGNETNNILFNNISDSYEKMKIEKKITYVGVLKNALRTIEKEMKINFDLRMELNIGSKKVAEIVNIIVDILKENNKEYYKECNIYFGFLVLAYYIKKQKMTDDEIFKNLFNIVEKMIEREEELNKLKLNNMHYNQANIYNFFINLAKEGSVGTNE